MKRNKTLLPKRLSFFFVKGLLILPFLLLFNTSAWADITVGGYITEDTLWDDTTQPYVVTNHIVIRNNATLTITPGVTVYLNHGVRVIVGSGETGTLIAEGTETDEITFTGDSEARWWDICFTGLTGAGSSLRHAVIENGGYNSTWLVAVDASSPSIQDCTLQNSVNWGIHILNNGQPTLANNTYRKNGGYPLHIYSALSIAAVDATSTFDNNGEDHIYYIGGEINTDTTIADPGIPYFVENHVVIRNNATLTINPGVTVYLNHAVRIIVGSGETGTLIAEGTETDEITFTGDSEARWWDIWFTGLTGAGSSLRHAVIENGGYNSTWLVAVDASSPAIQDCALQYSDGWGIHILNNGQPTLANNTYRKNGGYPLHIYSALSIAAVDATSTFDNNGEDHIYYIGGEINTDTTIADPGIPYFVENHVVIRNNATLTINPGVTVYLNHAVRIIVGSGETGTLIAEGTETDEITFTGDSEARWWDIWFTGLTGAGSSLRHAVIENGGYNSTWLIAVDASSPTIQSTTLRHSGNVGIYINGPTATPEITCNTITTNNVGIYTIGNADPLIHDNDIYGNTTYGLQNVSPSFTVVAESNYWGASGGPGETGADIVDGLVDYDPWLEASAPCTVPLQASFNASPTSGCDDFTVNFTDTSLGDTKIWEWDFDDSSAVNTAQNPTHIFTDPGTYQVSLTVQSDTEIDTASQDIIVSESLPTAEFTSESPLSGLPPLTVDFVDLSTICGTDLIESWSWDFDSDGIEDSTDQNPQHTYTSSGTYTVTLTVTDEDGDTDTETKIDYIIAEDCSFYYHDGDQDGYGTEDKQCLTEPNSSYTALVSGDCDDTNSAINPAAEEVCNGFDDNCNGLTDEGVLITFYADNDGDGYGSPAITTQACEPPSGYVSDGKDCNDMNVDINPDAEEECNGLDDNCNDQIDEGVLTTFYEDADGDSFGNINVTTQACEEPTGYVSDSTDCDDNNNLVNPWVMEEPRDGIDNNCDGLIDKKIQKGLYLQEE